MAIKERSLEETPTWAVAVVCFVLLFISIMIEYFLHFIGHWFKKKHKKALSEALEKVKAGKLIHYSIKKLMLLGFISLLLVVLQTPVSEICIPRNIAATWHPCSNHQEIAKYGKDYIDDGRKILEDFDSNDFYSPRRNLATKGYDKCAEKACNS
ncbi:MLO-like protein 12 [Arabidopsis thaliana]